MSPGLTVTDTVRNTFTASMLEARKDTRPLQRDQTPEHLVGTIVFLASEAAEFITGQTINVDGGAAMH